VPFVASCQKTMFYSICYDVKDDARRLKIAKVLKDYGTRVQLSVFEADLDTEKLERLKNRVRKVLNDSEDTLRLYPLCATCMSRIEIIGQGVVTQDPDVIVI
jgi:CRISPR-associated protein Cas2